ncbi:MAG: DUF3391 domain-containing protein [Nitrospinae bacterium]|nr:DUF3391 domain-containing protein [Nitrospinota bacterium]
MPKQDQSHIKKIRTTDLRVGMYVTQTDSPWLSTPVMIGGFEINSEKDIKKLLDYEIQTVSIDVSKGLDIGQELPLHFPEVRVITPDDTFEVEITEFKVGREMPVDIYHTTSDGHFALELKRGLSYTEEVEELFQGRGISQVRVPQDQRRAYDLYKRTLEGETASQKDKGFSDRYLDPKKVVIHYNFMDNYHAISPHALIDGTKPPFSVFVRAKEDVTLAHNAGDTIGAGTLEEWAHKDLNLLILKKEMPPYQAYLMEHTKNSKNHAARVTFVRENSKMIVEGLAHNPRSEQLMKETKESITDLTDLVIENPTTFYGLMKINNYDYYTFTHSVNVATLSLALAMAAGVHEKQDLADLGLGSILHDLGKSRVDQKLINKPGKLTDDEYKAVSNHVTLGYEMLKNHKSVPERALIPLLQHHEKLTGKGYPNKLAGDDIHYFGRIAAIIDIYDALTTERAYKKAFRPFDALALLTKSEGDFDMALITTFIKLIHRQET